MGRIFCGGRNNYLNSRLCFEGQSDTHPDHCGHNEVKPFRNEYVGVAVNCQSRLHRGSSESPRKDVTFMKLYLRLLGQS